MLQNTLKIVLKYPNSNFKYKLAPFKIKRYTWFHYCLMPCCTLPCVLSPTPTLRLLDESDIVGVLGQLRVPVHVPDILAVVAARRAQLEYLVRLLL